MPRGKPRQKGRKGNGEGSIIQRADGRWQGTISLGYKQDGTRDRKYTYGATFEEVNRKQLADLYDISRGLPVQSKDTRLSDFLAQWLEEVALPTTKPNTYRSYEVAVRVHLTPGLGRHYVQDLTPQQVQAFLNRKQSALSHATAVGARRVLVIALNHAMRWGLVHRNVASLTRLQDNRAVEGRVRALTKEQVGQLVRVLESEEWGAYYYLLVSMGLRKSEALALHWSDIDLDKRTLSVRYSIQSSKGALSLGTPKSSHAVRTISLPPSVCKWLRQHRVRQHERRMKLGEKWHDLDLVFPRRNGGLVNPAVLNPRLITILGKAGLPDTFTVHSLRHTAATSMLQSGVPIGVVSKILGHADAAITMRIYAHVFEEQKVEAADRIEAMLVGF